MHFIFKITLFTTLAYDQVPMNVYNLGTNSEKKDSLSGLSFDIVLKSEKNISAPRVN